jgi:DNA-binding SARP family transcriptional activator
MNRIKSKLLFICIVIGIISLPEIQAQGLRFYGNEESIEQRTTYFVFNKGSIPAFNQYLDFSFELKIQDFSTFGYLLHIVDTQNNTAYSFTYTYIDESSSAFKFNTEGKTNLISISFKNESIKSKWIPVHLHIDLSTGESSLSVAGRTRQSSDKIKTQKELKALLVFGRRENLVDVPCFSIRNLKITGNKQSFHFLLNESSGEDVHDTESRIRGEVTHPYWLINESYHWKRTLTIPSKTIMGSKFNEKDQSILFINQDSLFRYNVGNKKNTGEEYANKLPYTMLLGTNYLDEKTNKIYAYEINNLPAGSVTIGALDLATRSWKATGKAFTPVQLHHHNGYLSKDNQYIVFGGFGNRRYSNSFLAYNPATDRWDTLQFKGDRLSPRFYSSMAASKSGHYLYIYGGVGNDSGDQSVGHNYYDDLYRVDLQKHIIKKCWDNHSNRKLVSGEQMILSDDEKYLYVIRYAEYNEHTHLQLCRISVADGSCHQLGDSIPFISKSIASNVALYFNPVLQEFYCVTQEFDDFKKSVNAHVFTLSAPPVDQAAIHYYSKRKGLSFSTILVIAISSLCLIGLLLLYWKNKQKKRKPAPQFMPKFAPAPVQSETIPVPFSAKAIVNEAGLPDKSPAPKTEFNRIYLCGIFTVYGRSGRDVTYLFSNKLKQIFLYILLNSDHDGVSSTSLNNIFWPEKMDKKAKNLKGVTISNLRKALAEIDGVELIYDKGFFRIVISEPCYCDYTHLITLLVKNSQKCTDILNILERGQLMECSKQEFFDKYKQQNEDLIFSILPQELPVLYKKHEFRQVLRVCSVLLKMDPLYEPALVYSVYSYNRLNEYEKLYKVYALFTAEYRNSLGMVYPKSIETLIQEA